MAFSKLLTTYLDPTVPEIDDDSAPVTGDLAAEVDATISKTKTKKSTVDVKKASTATKRGIYSLDTRFLVILPLIGSLVMFVYHCTWVTSNAYSSPSVVLASRGADGSQHIIDDFREAYYWLRQNTKQDAVVMSWWDYGYQIAGMADRPTLVDNNTWNNTHIATVGKAMASNEAVAYPILRQHDVDYILVIFGGLLGYSGDDINKFLWMVRISQGVWPDEIQESNYFTNRGEYKVDAQA
jgi:dolichyl-diphosphooligosaccharide--protein glycosyltransferase